MSESEKDSDSEMNSIHQQSATDTSSEDEELEEEWYEEVNDVDYIKEIVEPLKTKEYNGLLKWLQSIFQDESNEREDILLDEKIPDWHCSIHDVKEVKEMIAALPIEEMGSLSKVLHCLKLRVADVKSNANTKIIPHSKKGENLMKEEHTVKVLNFLQLSPPKPGEFQYSPFDKVTKVKFWSIPSKWTTNELWVKIKFLEAMGYKTGNKEIRKRDIDLALKWIKSDLNYDVQGSYLFPQKDNRKILMKRSSVINFLTFLNLQPPSEDTKSWKIPRNMSVEELDSKADFIENIFFRDYPLQKVETLNRPLVGNFKKRQKLVNLVKCKECDVSFKSLLQHLKKAKKCAAAYDQDDMKDLREALKDLTRIRLRKNEQENKELRKKQKADHYQANKSKRGVQMDEYYRKNREKISKKKAEYNLKNKEKIAKEKAEKSQKEKKSILKKKD